MLYEWKHIIIFHKHLLADAPGAPRQWWFGGGTDFTPAYIFEEDVKHFHMVSLNTLSFLSFWIIWLSSEEILLAHIENMSILQQKRIDKKRKEIRASTFIVRE